jgi:hypothetical protein
MAQQKIKQQNTLQPLPDNFKLPPLTAEERKAIYAPKSSLEIIKHRPPMPVRVVKTTAKTAGWLFGMIGAISGGILLSESKRGFRS